MRKAFLRILTVLAVLALSLPMSAQQRTVSGKVLDASDGQPVIGAGIVVSTGGGTITDYDGNYVVTVATGATLTFSSLGYQQLVETVDGRSVINVSLQPDTHTLDEVVVLGYTTQKKAEISSSVVSMSGEKLHDVTSADIGNMLQGKAAGVVVMNSTGQPGSQADIRIRGTGSITAGAGPLYVVDGVAGGDFNANDVETITILKDASATALYGAAAAGGVIVITTKNAAQEKAVVNFKASAGIKKALTGRFHPMNSEELYEEQSHMYSKMLFSMQRPEYLLDQDFDWVDACFKTGVVQNYYISASGKAGKTSYFVSIDHYDEQGSLINTNYDRNSARINLSTAITDNLTMNVRLSYKRAHSQEESSYVTLECAYRALPWDIPYVIDAEGNITDEVLYVDGAKRSDNGKPWFSHDKYNILHNEQFNYGKGSSEDLVGDIQLIWNINDHFTITSTNRFDSSNSFYEQYIDPRTKSPSYSTGYLYNSDGEWSGWGTTDLLKYHNTFGDHDINAIVGWEYGEGYSRSLSAAGTDMPNGQRAISNCVYREMSGYDYHSRTWALLAQAQYSFLGKYIATASIRYDESYKFGPLSRGGYFPGISAAWIASKEDFMEGQDIFSFLKVRGGYGKTGNDNISAFKYQDMYALSAKYEDVVSAVLERQANPKLGWEEAYMTSLGIDATIRKNVNVTVDLYNTLNTNLLLAVPTATSTGFFEFMDNVGAVRNRGVEFAIDGNIINTRDLTFNMGLNLGFNKNTVMELPDHEDMIQSTSQGIKQRISEGKDIYTWYLPKWAGVDPATGDPLWEVVAEDGTVTTTNIFSQATNQEVGTASPLFSGGISANLRWKNFTLSANGSFVYGNKVFNQTRTVMDSDGAYNDYNQMSINNGLGWSRWEEPGDEATHPKVMLNGNKSSNAVSSRYLEDGSFFRLRNITLGYDLPKPFLTKIRISDARVYVSADNILTLSKFSGMDPEVRLEGSEYYLAGTYSNNYPVPMSIVAGIDIKF